MADRLLFPPTTVADMRQRGWDAPDFVYVSGDAYVDHPSFGAVRTVSAKQRRRLFHFPFAIKRRRRKPDFHADVPPFVFFFAYVSLYSIRAGNVTFFLRRSVV